MPKIKKITQKKLFFSVYLVSAFILALGFLIGTPKAIDIIDNRLVFLGNSSENKLQPVISDVAGAQKVGEVKTIPNPSEPPEFSSKAVLAKDFETEFIFYQKNIDTRMSPASTTKIMTALIAVEHFRPADILVVPTEALVGGSSMGLKVGEQLTFRSLLYGMMLNSGNDASFTIAANYPGGVYAFVEKMNQKVKELGLGNTHFENPAGFDSPNHYSTASDLAKIGKAAVENVQLAKVVGTKETAVISWDKSNAHSLKNLNQLLSEEGVIGIKTGFTENAGESFVGLVERNNHPVILVVLGSEDRFADTTTLIEWVYSNFRWASLPADMPGQ